MVVEPGVPRRRIVSRRPQARPPSTDCAGRVRGSPAAGFVSRMTTVLGVVGGSGGVGASTFAGVLAATAGSAVLVDLDPAGGGIDVVLGIEAVFGARWSGLQVDGGRLDPAVLLGGLPYCGSCAVLAADTALPGAAAVAQVIDAAASSGVDAVVLDLARCASPQRAAALGRCDLVAVLARCDVAGLVSAHAQVGALDDDAAGVPIGVVARRGSVPAAEVSRIVGASLLGVLPASGPSARDGTARVPRGTSRLASGLLGGLVGTPGHGASTRARAGGRHGVAA